MMPTGFFYQLVKISLFISLIPNQIISLIKAFVRYILYNFYSEPILVCDW